MTDDNSNLIAEQLERDKQSKEILSNITYTLDYEKYNQLNRQAALYESLNVLLEPFDSDDSALSDVVTLLHHLNSSFYDFIETIEPDLKIN